MLGRSYEPSWSDIVFLARRMGLLPSEVAAMTIDQLWQLEDDARTMDALTEYVEIADNARKRKADERAAHKSAEEG